METDIYYNIVVTAILETTLISSIKWLVEYNTWWLLENEICADVESFPYSLREKLRKNNLIFVWWHLLCKHK